MRRYKIYVACGSGLATSHLLAEQLREMLKQRGIEADINTTKVSDLGNGDGCDLIVTSTTLSNNYNVPVVRAISFLTGVGMERDLEKIINHLETINSDRI